MTFDGEDVERGVNETGSSPALEELITKAKGEREGKE